jgi:DnaJ-class molecular chaperone with C-terminal Zn finger domain
MELGDFDEAVRDYERALKMDNSRGKILNILCVHFIRGVFMLLFKILMFWIFTENKRLLQEAKLALKKSKRKDYYKILGVDKNASTDEIKKAYRKRALVHHPG